MTDWTDGPVRVLLGKALARLRELPDASADSLVTDPPAGISFMGRAWDTFPTRDRPAGHVFADGRARPGVAGGQEHDPRMRRPFIAFMTEVAAECLRVLKPGAHGLVWAIPRTSHWTATALEDAGFEIRPEGFVLHHFATGYPKNLNVGRAIDSRVCLEIGRHFWTDTSLPTGDKARPGDHVCAESEVGHEHRGEGTGLKPATEVWWLVRKPLSERTVAANVLEHGTGALNIDGGRVDIGAGGDREGEASADRRYAAQAGDFAMLPGPRGGDARGRWPANVAFSHGEGCVPMGTRRVRAAGWRDGDQSLRERSVAYNSARDGSLRGTGGRHYAAADGTEEVEAWSCVEGCPVAELDRQSGTLQSGFMAAGTEREGLGYRGGLGSRVRNDTHGDTGGASRFFYVAKASTRERSAGLPPGLRNEHPTVKPIALMRWLCRLVTPPGGLVLDPFMGSGTTGIAAVLEGCGFVGIEQDPESVRTAIARLQHWRHEPDLLEAPLSL